jgi:hypothetical protein
MGLTRRQHDPDWQPDGSITIFDNNLHRDRTRIVMVRPEDFSSELIFDGDQENVYTQASGNHQILPNGNIQMTVSHQGRVIEVTPDGEVVFEFINVFDLEKDKVLYVMECFHLPEDYFDFEEFPACLD